MHQVLSFILCGLFPLISFAQQEIRQGEVLLQEKKHSVQIKFTHISQGFSSKNSATIGDLTIDITDISADSQLSGSLADGSKEVVLYLDESFQNLQHYLDTTIEMIAPTNLDEVNCQDDVNAMIVIYNNEEPYDAVLNCLKLDK